jgi:phosphoribosylglycinamide formyltransferase-1
MRLCVLISGNGSNLQALIDARDQGQIELDIVTVISNRADARGLEKAGRAGIPTTILEHQGFADRNDFDHALTVLISAGKPDLVMLAGFMRIVGPGVLDHFQGRIINLHPSLLPLYRGTDTYQRALDAGDNEHGASIQFVTGELDGGPVISQVRIPVLPGENKDSLADRLAPMEHRLVVATVGFITRHRVECRNTSVFVDEIKLTLPLQLQSDDTLTRYTASGS